MFLLKETNDELLRISRGSLFHIESAAQLKPRLPMTVETAGVYLETGDCYTENKERADE